MPKMSRDKGAGAERELSHILNDFYGFKTRRGDCFRFEPDVIGLDGIHIEVKRREFITLTPWIRQARDAADRYKDGLPAVFHRRNREPWFVSMLKNDFQRLHGGEVRLQPVTGKVNPVEDCAGEIDGCIYFRKIGEIVTMPLGTWVGFYTEVER